MKIVWICDLAAEHASLFLEGGRLAPCALDRDNFKIAASLDAHMRKARIRCPHCQWQPARTDAWMCWSTGAPEFYSDGCGTSWNTFDTAGRCPGCDHLWRYTMCLSCDRWALHSDWYEPGEEGQLYHS